MTVRVRYNGRDEERHWVDKMGGGYWETVRGCPKNTLVTVREGGRIFFGISRYDARYGVPFTKKKGRKVAQGRAMKLQREWLDTPFPETLEGIFFSESGMAGACSVDNVTLVLKYFDDIDQLAPQGKLLYDATDRVQMLAGVEGHYFVTPLPLSPMVKEKEIPTNPERLQQLAGV